MEQSRKIRPELIGVAEESRKNKDYQGAFNLATQGLGIDSFGGLREEEINMIDPGYLFPLIRISFDSLRGRGMRTLKARECLRIIYDGLNQVIESGYSQSAKLVVEKFSHVMLFNMRRDISRFGELAGPLLTRDQKIELDKRGINALLQARQDTIDPTTEAIIDIEIAKIRSRYWPGIDTSELSHRYREVLETGNKDQIQAATDWLGEIGVQLRDGDLLKIVLGEGRTDGKQIATRAIKRRCRELIVGITANRIPIEKRNDLFGRVNKIAQVWVD